MFGQTFLCITLKDVVTADEAAQVFHLHSQPQIIDMNLPQTIDPAKYPNLVQLAHDMGPALESFSRWDPIRLLTLHSYRGMEFRLFVKSKDWKVSATDKVQDAKDLLQ